MVYLYTLTHSLTRTHPGLGVKLAILGQVSEKMPNIGTIYASAEDFCWFPLKSTIV